MEPIIPVLCILLTAGAVAIEKGVLKPVAHPAAVNQTKLMEKNKE
jgi:hypothetical protein